MFLRNVSNLRYKNLYFLSQHRGVSYVVLLPEVPPDTAEDNVLLRGDRLPKFAGLTAEKSFNAVGKLALDYESGFWSLEESLKDKNQIKTFDSLINQLDVLDAPLTTVWSAVKLLYITQNNDMTSEYYTKIHERAKVARSHKFQSSTVFNACKEIKDNEKDLTDAQHRVLDKYILEGKLNGMDLTPKKQQEFWSALKNLEKAKYKFRTRLEKATDQYSLQIANEKNTAEFPESLLKLTALKKENYKSGPWVATLHPHIYPEIMKYCPNREIRKNCWQGFVMRGSSKLSKDVETGSLVSEIRKFRLQQANCLGFKNFAEMSMKTKMAGSTQNVISMIERLNTQAKISQRKELNSLQHFAEGRGFTDTIEAHDVMYWRRRQKRELYNFSESQLSEYFPFEHVWTQLLLIASQLFNISFEEELPDTSIKWNQDVRMFNVLDEQGNILSQFFLDPYQRPGEKIYSGANSAWSVSLRNKSVAAQNSPVSALIFNFKPPTDNVPSLLSFTDVTVLFKKFGDTLQHLLTTNPYGDSSGQINIEWDSIGVCANFMANWLYEPSILERISQHYDSELPLSGSSIQDIIASRKHLAGYDMSKELYFSHLDLALYSSDDYWLDIVKQLWEEYRPFELNSNDSHVCSFSPVLTDVWAAAYYSHIWSNMIAANVFMQFKNASTEQELTETGIRFRETFLALGGGCHPNEVFNQFTGSDPSPEALHEVIGLM